MTWHWRTRDGGDAVAAIVTVDGRTRIVARPQQFSGVWTIYDGVHEWEELQFCLRYLRPGDHFVDVGANVGVFSTLVGTRIPGVRITAVEPFPPVREDLLANLALNDLSITVVDAALSDTAGEATFEVLDRDVLNRLAPEGDLAGDRITVPVTTLDELVGDDPPALIKIDVEGSELLVMKGARRLLSDATAAPVLLFEHAGYCEHFGITPAEVRTFLREVGYSIYLLDGDAVALALRRTATDAQRHRLSRRGRGAGPPRLSRRRAGRAAGAGGRRATAESRAATARTTRTKVRADLDAAPATPAPSRWPRRSPARRPPLVP